jgi:outer membrane receptor for ferrienterochelin and colicin
MLLYKTIYFKKYLIHILLLFLFFFTQALHSGIYGTLTGQVIDKKSGEPLIGVNIILQDMGMGAATDEDGFFLITQIPPGKYDLSAQMLGYRTEIKKNVTILVDLRTTVLFELEETSMRLGEEIIVTAETPLLQRDITATTHFISSNEFNAMPVRNFKEIVEIQPGVAAGHVRGGRKDEVLYLVDGLPIREAIDGDIGTSLPNSAIVDMTIQTGGFNAEYGNAMSGVVNILTREGENKFFSRAEIAATYLNNIPKPFPGSSINNYEVDLSSGGKLFPKSKYFISMNYLFPNSTWKKEEFGVRRMMYNDSESHNFNLSGKLTYQLTNTTKLNLQGLISLWDWTEYDHQWKLNLPGLVPQSKKSYRFNFSLAQSLSNRSYFNFYISQYKVLKSVYGKSSLEQEPVEYQTDEYGRQNYAGYVVSGDYPWWMDHEEIHNLAKFDFVNQINYNHQIKFGGEVTLYDLYKKNVMRKELYAFDPKFPRYISYDTEYNYSPYQGAIYLQDKIEYNGIVTNAGLRYDFFNPRASRPEVEQQIFGVDTAWVVSDRNTVPAKVKHQVSPRLGITFPITAASDLRFNYGYFFQMPQFEYLYTNANMNVVYGFAPLGDPEMKPAKTVAYEMGYRTAFHNNYLLDITFFNKEVTNLVDSFTFLNSTSSTSGIFSYGLTRFMNSSSVNIHGLEIFLKKRLHKNFGGKISYTFMNAKGNSSSAFENIDWIDRDFKVSKDQFPLSWDQTHTLVFDGNFQFFNSWHLNLLWRWNSGLPYTRDEGFNTKPNNHRLSPTYYLDLRIEKGWGIAKSSLMLFTEIYNLFDTRNVLWVDSFGIPGGRLGDISAWDLGRRMHLGMIVNL